MKQSSGARALTAAWPARRWIAIGGSTAVLAGSMAITCRQIGFWQSDATLWRHALACDSHNATAHCLLGAALWERDLHEAKRQYQQVLDMGPPGRRVYRGVRAAAHNRLGLLAARVDLAGAIAHYQEALEADPTLVPAHINLGSALSRSGDLAAAMTHFEKALELRPDNTIALVGMAVALNQFEKTDEAIAALRQAVAIDPNLAVAQANLATLLVQQGHGDEAIEHYRRALEIDPGSEAARRGLDQLTKLQQSP